MERPLAYSEDVNRYEFTMSFPSWVSASSPALQRIAIVQLLAFGLLLLIRLSLAPGLSWWWVTLPFWILPALVFMLVLIFLLALLLTVFSKTPKHDLK